jgi:HAMP domain-containing protein
VLSAVLAQKHAETFWLKLERHVRDRGEQGEVLDDLREEKRSLIRELASIRLFVATSAMATVSTMIVVILRRRLSRPLSILSDRIHKMRLGTWNEPIPDEEDDEVGSLTQPPPNWPAWP